MAKTKTASITFEEFIHGKSFTILENNNFEFYRLETINAGDLIIAKHKIRNSLDSNTEFYCCVKSITKSKTVKLYGLTLFNEIHTTTLKFLKDG